MVSYLDVTNYFIIRSHDDGLASTMTNMKAQKLLYYSQSLHLALYSKPLFDEQIQAWRLGPVCPPAYREYCKFEAEQLPFPNRSTLGNIPKDVVDLLEKVWTHCGERDAFDLSRETHQELPWIKARNGLPPDARSTEPLLASDMEELGLQKLDEIETASPIYRQAVSILLEDAFSVSTVKSEVKQGDVRDWLNSLLA